MPGNSTLDPVGSKSVLLKTTSHEKEKVSVALAAIADGTKLPRLSYSTEEIPSPAADIPSLVRDESFDEADVDFGGFTYEETEQAASVTAAASNVANHEITRLASGGTEDAYDDDHGSYYKVGSMRR